MPSIQHMQPVVLFDLRNVVEMTLPTLAAACQQRLDAGERLLALFGRPAPAKTPAKCMVTAVFEGADGGLHALRALAQAGDHYPSLTASHPSAQIHERELWEQTGIVPDGHPWLKPVRFEGRRQQQFQDYPFFPVHGQEVHEVGVGPIHAGVIEPGHFRFMCLGETVHHLEIQLGYQHRGVEALLLRRPHWALSPIVESICGDSAVAYAWAHCAALEALCNTPVSLETSLSRAVGLELERIAMHLATLTGLATDIAFLQGGGTYGRLRTAIINASQRVCGNRFGRGWIRPGCSASLGDALRTDLLQTLGAFARDCAQIDQLMLKARSVQARFKGVGTVTQQTAHALGLRGVVARASGVPLDIRMQLPGDAFVHTAMPLLTETDGDCWARMVLRMREVEASTHWLQTVLQDPTLDLACAATPAAPRPLMPSALCVSVVEGTRGAVVQVLETSATGELLHYKVQDPSLANWFGLAMALRNNGISDFPICNKSFDLSYCGNDL
jgi:Ni,Fe-hydrogenase III large subunit/Ni,Fe-hydrogenase III component G